MTKIEKINAELDRLAKTTGHRSVEKVLDDPYPLRMKSSQWKAKQIRKFWLED